MLKTIKNLLNIKDTKTIEEDMIREELEEGLGKSVKQGTTGYFDGLKLYDSDE